MAHTLLVHITNEDPIVLDVDELPDPTHAFLFGMNPRYRDGKDVQYILSEVTQIILPWHRISFIELMPSADEEGVVGIARD